MAIDFPNNPSNGDTYTVNGKTWQWDGTVWAAYGNYLDPGTLNVDKTNGRVGINNTNPTVALDVTGAAAISSNLVVGGDFTVSGTTTTINTTDLNVEDNIITLNYGVTGTPTLDAGIEVERGDLANTSITWDESAASWVVGGTAYVDTANGRVGIGTATPTVPLDVVGDVNIATASGDGYLQVLYQAIDTALYANLTASGQMDAQEVSLFAQNPNTETSVPLRLTGSTVHVVGDLNVDQDTLFVDASTNRVGIGTTSPDSTLQVNGIAKTGDLTVVNNGLSESEILIDSNNGLGVLRRGSGYFDIYARNSADTGYDTIYFNGLTATITNNRVGIGTISPNETLDVQGSIGFSTGGGRTAGSLFSDSNWGLITTAAQSSPAIAEFAWFNAGDTERMRIDTSGNVGINDTTPSYKLDVNGDINATGRIRINGYPTMGGAIYCYTAGYTSTWGSTWYSRDWTITAPSGTQFANVVLTPHPIFTFRHSIVTVRSVSSSSLTFALSSYGGASDGYVRWVSSN